MAVYFKRYEDFRNNRDCLGEYRLALSLYYDKTANCPKCPKEEIIRSSEHGKLIMKCVKCKWRVEITPLEIKDIYTDRSQTKKKRNDLIYKLVNSSLKEEKEKFHDELKLYNEAKQIYKDINALIEREEKDLIELKGDLYAKQNDLINIYFHRKQIFKKIEGTTTNETLQKMYKIVKNEGMPDKKRIDKFSKDNELGDPHLWFEWIDLSLKYLNLKVEIAPIIEKMQKFQKDLNCLNQNFMIKLPKLKGDSVQPRIKKIKVKKVEKPKIKKIKVKKVEKPKEKPKIKKIKIKKVEKPKEKPKKNQLRK